MKYIDHVFRPLWLTLAATVLVSGADVKLHRTSITTKLQVGSVAELTRIAQAAGLLDEPLPAFPKGK